MKGKIFNAQEMQAILNGSKVMFREVVKNQVPADFKYCHNEPYLHQHNNRFFFTGQNYDWWFEECPYQVGQKIFCKESFSYSNQPWCDKTIFYKASNGDRIQHTFSVSQRENKWRSPMVMQEYDSRLTLLIKDIKVEKLADIAPFDCVCEGIWDGRNVALGMSGKAVEAFKDNWNATHKKPEEKFEASPFCWVVSFEVINN